MYQIAFKDQREKLHRDHGTHGGVYKLHCLSNEDAATFKCTHRLLGDDPDGVLYIGKTAPGLARIGDLTKSLSPNYKSNGHHVGLRYAKNSRLSEEFPFERLCVTFIPADDPATVERDEIQAYLQKYGEVPPFNANEP